MAHIYNRRFILTLITALACSAAFIILANVVTNGSTETFDRAVMTTIHRWSSSFLNTFFVLITQLGSLAGVVILGSLLLLSLLRRRMYYRAILLVKGVALAALINPVLKQIYKRPRPDLWNHLVATNSYSFPSGHAMSSSALTFCVIVIFWKTRYKIPATVIAIVYMPLIGFSRMYLGVHYPTDVLAGWLASGAIIAIVYLAVNWWKSQHAGKE